MRVYEKARFACKQKKTRVAFDGNDVGVGNAKDLAPADDCINCDYGDGVIRACHGGVGFSLGDKESFSLPYGAADLDAFFLVPNKKEQGVYEFTLGYITAQGVLYVYDGSLGAFIRKYTFGVKMRPIEVMDGEENARLFFAGEAGLFAFDGESVTEVEIERAAGEKVGRAVCACADRLFAVLKPYTLAYSAPLAPDDFSVSENDGGRICFPSDKGEIVGLAAVGSALTMFYEYGIARLETGGSARDFALEKIAYGGGRIFGDSVGSCGVGGEKTFFLASDGLYSLHGKTVRKLDTDTAILPVRTGQVCDHAESNGKYYLAYTDEAKGRTGLCVDTQTGKVYATYAAKGLSNCGGRAMAARDGSVVFLHPDGALPYGENCVFSLRASAFGVAGRKTFRRLRLYGSGEITVRVGNGRTERVCSARFVNGETSVDVRLRGEAFSVAVTIAGNGYVRSAAAEFLRAESVSADNAVDRVQ